MNHKLLSRKLIKWSCYLILTFLTLIQLNLVNAQNTSLPFLESTITIKKKQGRENLIKNYLFSLAFELIAWDIGLKYTSKSMYESNLSTLVPFLNNTLQLIITEFRLKNTRKNSEGLDYLHNLLLAAMYTPESKLEENSILKNEFERLTNQLKQLKTNPLPTLSEFRKYLLLMDKSYENGLIPLIKNLLSSELPWSESLTNHTTRFVRDDIASGKRQILNYNPFQYITPILTALKNDDPERMRTLLLLGADSIVDTSGLLSLSVRDRRTKIQKFLFETEVLTKGTNLLNSLKKSTITPQHISYPPLREMMLRRLKMLAQTKMRQLGCSQEEILKYSQDLTNMSFHHLLFLEKLMLQSPNKTKMGSCLDFFDLITAEKTNPLLKEFLIDTISNDLVRFNFTSDSSTIKISEISEGQSFIINKLILSDLQKKLTNRHFYQYLRDLILNDSQRTIDQTIFTRPHHLIDHTHLWRGTPIGNQGDVGSCHVFATVAMLEAFIKEKTGKKVKLSEADLFYQHLDQQIHETKWSDFKKYVDLVKKQEGSLSYLYCEGGFMHEDLRLIKMNGIVEYNLLPYNFTKTNHPDKLVIEKMRKAQNDIIKSLITTKDKSKVTNSLNHTSLQRSLNLAGLDELSCRYISKVSPETQHLYDDYFSGLSFLKINVSLLNSIEKMSSLLSYLYYFPIGSNIVNYQSILNSNTHYSTADEERISKSKNHKIRPVRSFDNSNVHTVVIAGYNSINGQFIIRNSWGSKNHDVIEADKLLPSILDLFVLSNNGIIVESKQQHKIIKTQ